MPGGEKTFRLQVRYGEQVKGLGPLQCAGAEVLWSATTIPAAVASAAAATIKTVLVRWCLRLGLATAGRQAALVGHTCAAGACGAGGVCAVWLTVS